MRITTLQLSACSLCLSQTPRRSTCGTMAPGLGSPWARAHSHGTLCFARPPRIETIEKQQRIKHNFSALGSEPPLSIRLLEVCLAHKPKTGEILKNEGESSIDGKLNGRDKGRRETFPDVTNVMKGIERISKVRVRHSIRPRVNNELGCV